jgi:hypothetical protein
MPRGKAKIKIPKGKPKPKGTAPELFKGKK